MSQDDPHRQAADEAEQTRAEARGAELRTELAETDARREEEEATKAHEAVEEAQKQEEKERREAEEARERARRVAAEAERERDQAEQAARARDETARPTTGAVRAGPPTASQSPAERPEVLLGAALAGSFVLGRILKRFFD